MRGCTQLLAGIFVVIFIITAVFTLFLVNLAHGLTDRDTVKSVLNLEPLAREALPGLLADGLRRSAAERGLAVDQIDEAALDAAFDVVVPPGYIDGLTETAVDGLYDYLETGDPAQATLALDVKPMIDRLQGEPGRQATLALAQSLPPCEQSLSPEQIQAGQIELDNCLPPNVPAETAALMLHQAIVDGLNENPQVIGEGVVRLNLFEASQMNQQQLAQAQRIQRTFVFLQRWSWSLWFIPLLSLMIIFTLAVRSVSQWGHWWGWPLLLAGLFAFILAAMVPAVLLVYSRTAMAITADGGLTVAAMSGRLAQSLSDLWLRRVLIQAGLLGFIGLGFVIMGFVTTTGRPVEEPYPVSGKR
jgi:hypothetical protein